MDAQFHKINVSQIRWDRKDRGIQGYFIPRSGRKSALKLYVDKYMAINAHKAQYRLAMSGLAPHVGRLVTTIVDGDTLYGYETEQIKVFRDFLNGKIYPSSLPLNNHYDEVSTKFEKFFQLYDCHTRNLGYRRNPLKLMVLDLGDVFEGHPLLS